MTSPSTSCPHCGAKIVLPDEVPETVKCPTCGRVAEFSNPDAVTLAYLDAGVLALGFSAGHSSPQSTSVRSQNVVVVADEQGREQIALSRAGSADVERRSGPSLSIDGAALSDFLGQLPQLAVAAVVANEASAHVVMTLAPHLAASLRSGTATMMSAVTGGFRGNVIDSATNAIIGQASFAPASVATLGAAAAWQAASFVVAQKHLADIRARLDAIESHVLGITRRMDDAISAKLRGDWDHLASIAKSTVADSSGDELSDRRAEVSSIIRDARGRREELRKRIQTHAETFTQDRGARYFDLARTLGKSADFLKRDIESFGAHIDALRQNSVLLSAGVAVHGHLGAGQARVEADLADLRHYMTEDDKLLTLAGEKLRHSVMSVRGTITRRPKTEARARADVASTFWHAVQRGRQLRELVEVHSGERERPARVLLEMSGTQAVRGTVLVD